jgi:hypothetical protein
MFMEEDEWIWADSAYPVLLSVLLFVMVLRRLYRLMCGLWLHTRSLNVTCLIMRPSTTMCQWFAFDQNMPSDSSKVDSILSSAFRLRYPMNTHTNSQHTGLQHALVYIHLPCSVKMRRILIGMPWVGREIPLLMKVFQVHHPTLCQMANAVIIP